MVPIHSDHLELQTIPALEESIGSILFVHGAGHAAWCWQNAMEPFARHHFTCHALSLRGHGSSWGHAELNQWRVRDYVEDIRQAVSQLEPPVTLVGHSLGGMLIGKYLEQDHAINAAVMIAPLPIRQRFANWLYFLKRHSRAMYLLSTKQDLRPLMAELAEEFFSNNIPLPEQNAYRECLTDESFTAMMDAVLLETVHPERVTTPLLVIGVEDDAVVTRRMINSTAQAYKVKPTYFAGAHDLMLEPNWSDVAYYILNWLGAFLHPNANSISAPGHHRRSLERHTSLIPAVKQASTKLSAL